MFGMFKFLQKEERMRKIIFPLILILSLLVINSASALFYDFENKNQLKDWEV
jgi:Na+-transporting methylmalonyl-CoA/oxaloacetate decarboxylase beta subunit